MPIYEYCCKSCGVNFDKFQRIDSEPVAEFEYCPNHHEGCDIQRVISAPSLVKGTETTNADTATTANQGTPTTQNQTPETLMAQRTQSLQQQFQQRLQSFMQFKKKHDGK